MNFKGLYISRYKNIGFFLGGLKKFVQYRVNLQTVTDIKFILRKNNNSETNIHKYNYIHIYINVYRPCSGERVNKNLVGVSIM